MWQSAKRANRDSLAVMSAAGGWFPAMIVAFFVLRRLSVEVQVSFFFGHLGLTTFLLLYFLLAVIGISLTVPWLIAAHRNLLVAKPSAFLGGTFGNGRFFTFLAFTALLNLAFAVLMLAPFQLGTPFAASLALWALALVMILVLVFRTILMFPAIAVDAPGLSVSAAIADSKGRTLQMFLTIVLANLPAMIFMAAAAVLLSLVHLKGISGTLVTGLLGSAFGVWFLTINAALASRWYEEFAQSLKRPAIGHPVRPSNRPFVLGSSVPQH